YPIILIYAKGEMIEPSPEILDELVIFDDLNITRIKAQESKRFQEVRFAKPPGDSIQLRAYMIYDMESQDSLYKDLHSITDEIVISR
ncbi:MAG: hypothetical protein RI564_03565, partial [Gracilimonas sp.]|nr:hypothetical protein [Gracilimonas sp.]